MITFTNFHKDRRKIEDFLFIAKFWARELFFTHPLQGAYKYVPVGLKSTLLEQAFNQGTMCEWDNLVQLNDHADLSTIFSCRDSSKSICCR